MPTGRCLSNDDGDANKDPDPVSNDSQSNTMEMNKSDPVDADSLNEAVKTCATNWKNAKDGGLKCAWSMCKTNHIFTFSCNMVSFCELLTCIRVVSCNYIILLIYLTHLSMLTIQC